MISAGAHRLIVPLAILGAALVAFAVLRSDDDQGEDGRPVATVSGITIPKARFEKSYIDRLTTTGRNDTPLERYRHLDRLIQNRLLADEARQRGLNQGSDYEEFVGRHRLMAAGARYFDESLEDRLPPLSEEEVRDAYRHAREQVVLRQLFFRSQSQAEWAFSLLRDGEDFVELANEVFDTPAFDSSAGMLGAASYWSLDDAVAEVAFNLERYEVSTPVRSRHGWHILRLEDRYLNPILSEDDFQMRRESVEGRLRIRRNRIEGDRWVDAFRVELDPQVDTEAARLIVDALEQSLYTDSSVPQVQVTPEEIEQVRAVLRPETAVVTYTLDGEVLAFTAGDFVRWLPELPYEEVRDRPMASLGRALRNQALGIRGLGEGYGDDPWAVEAVQAAEDQYLSEQLRERLQTDSDYEPSESELQEAFQQLRAGELVEARADYWEIPFAGFGEARDALAAIRDGRAPGSWGQFKRFEGADIRTSELGAHLRRAPLQTPLVVCLSDETCSVVQVDGRSIRQATLEDKRAELQEMLSRLMPEERLTDSLRRVSGVSVDTTLFNRMMRG